MRNVLVAIELALATMLLIGAGLFIQTLVNLQSVKLGFEPHGLVTFQVSLPANKVSLQDEGRPCSSAR